ncbi:MAG: dCTP deaminase [Blastocatellia bacterium]|jgi:deoxycytidine triphosphate deaminase|nr:dCTP deaminase [Blastocatellia bacterium]
MSGILTYDDIVVELANNRLIVNGDAKYVEACSYDMRVGTIFREGLRIKGRQDQTILQPGDIVSLFTMEELDLPADVAATAFALNAMSSQGILVLNPGHVDPGYKGPLTVRAINLRATPKAIDVGTRIFTVIFERLPRRTSRPYPPIPGDKEDRELKFNSIDVEQNPHSMARLVMLGKDRPLMTGDEVDRRINEHWTTKATLVGTLAGVILALIAALFAVIGVYRTESVRPNQTNSTPSTPTASPSLPTETTGQAVNSGQTQKNDNVKQRHP